MQAVEPRRITPEVLEKLVLEASTIELVCAFESLPESERKKLSSSAINLYKTIRRRDLGQVISDSLKGLVRRIANGKAPSFRFNAKLAVFACCPLSHAKKVDPWRMDDTQEAAFIKLLLDRRPSWLTAWVEYRLEETFPGISWPVLRTLVAAGACEKPTGDGYIRLMASHFYVWRLPKGESFTPLSRQLLEMPDVLEADIYRLFEVETSIFWRNAYDKTPAPPGFETWTKALTRLSEEGHIDRQRLLDASLAGLSAELNPNMLSGFRKVHEKLKPSIEEIRQRESRYRSLLREEVGHVVRFALTKLSKLARVQQFDAPAFLQEAGCVFNRSAKGTAMSVLKLVKRLNRKQSGLFQESARLCAEALKHPATDVQELAVEILEYLEGGYDGQIRQLIQKRIPAISPSLRPRVQHLIGVAEAKVETTLSYDALFDRMTALSDEGKQCLGLDTPDLLRSYPPPLRLPDPICRQLNAIERIRPIQDVEELIDTISHAVERIEYAEEAERILDGLSRLGAERAADFSVRTAALLQSVKTPAEGDNRRGLIDGWGSLTQAFRDLLMTWLSGELHETPDAPFNPTSAPLRFPIRRLRELGKRIHKKEMGPLLAGPTHAGGWIDPIVFVQRLLELGEGWRTTHREDLKQGLLRLAHGGRGEALVLASRLEGCLGKIVRWALGGPEKPTEKDRADYNLWIMAGRARIPRGSLEDAYASMGVEDHLPDSIYPATYTWHATLRSTRNAYTYPQVDISNGFVTREEAQLPLFENTPIERAKAQAAKVWKKLVGLPARLNQPAWKRIPTAALHVLPVRGPLYDLQGTWLVRWLFFIWPQNIDSALVIGIHEMMRRVDENVATTIPNFVYLEPAFESDRPWGELLLLAIWIGMIAKDAELNGSAVDALIEGIADGRAHPDEMAEILGRLVKGGWVKMNRLAASVRQVSQISAQHAYAMGRVLDDLVSGLAHRPNNLHHLLEVLLKVLVELHLQPSMKLIERLQSLKGSSKTAKLARKLCRLRLEGDMTPIFVEAVEQRLKRWENVSTTAASRYMTQVVSYYE